MRYDECGKEDCARYVVTVQSNFKRNLGPKSSGGGGGGGGWMPDPYCYTAPPVQPEVCGSWNVYCYKGRTATLPAPDLDATGTACAFVCVGVGAHSEGKKHMLASVGAGVGPEIGASGQFGASYNGQTGWNVHLNCILAAGPLGIYGEVGVQQGDSMLYGGAGWAPGAEIGCSVGFAYTWRVF